MTDRQFDVLKFIHEHNKEKGFPPTTREISKKFGWESQTSGVDAIKALQRKGVVEVASSKARGVSITEHGMRAIIDDGSVSFDSLPRTKVEVREIGGQFFARVDDLQDAMRSDRAVALWKLALYMGSKDPDCDSNETIRRGIDMILKDSLINDPEESTDG